MSYSLENNVPQPGSPRAGLASSTLTSKENRLVSFLAASGYTLTDNVHSPVHGLVLDGSASAGTSTIRPWIVGDVYSVRVSAAVTAGDKLQLDTTNTGELLTATTGPAVAQALASTSGAGNVLVIAVSTNGAQQAIYGAPAPVAVNTTATITTTDVKPNAIFTSTTAAAVAATTPTGTQLTAQLPHVAIGHAIDIALINTGGSNAFTLTAGTDVSIVGAAAVAASSSGTFRLKRTATTTWIAYRI